MENPVKVHFHCNLQGCITLALQCPTCGEQQGLPITDVDSGIGFICKCGEDIPIHAEALKPVAHELEELRHLIQRTIVLPI
ncbi:MAG: hypothetical protein V2I41_19870 [Pseudomonadales bacterium]|jgi:hypothetical protein|nr:hypothetical protein [Pseudomonadales bacterium]